MSAHLLDTYLSCFWPCLLILMLDSPVWPLTPQCDCPYNGVNWEWEAEVLLRLCLCRKSCLNYLRARTSWGLVVATGNPSSLRGWCHRSALSQSNCCLVLRLLKFWSSFFLVFKEKWIWVINVLFPLELFEQNRIMIGMFLISYYFGGW